MTDKRPSSVKARRECFEANRLRDKLGVYMICHICGGRIDPVRQKWEAEHVIPHYFGGEELKPAHENPCHRRKTHEEDRPAIQKSKNTADSHFGIKRKGWGGKYRKKLDGSAVER